MLTKEYHEKKHLTTWLNNFLSVIQRDPPKFRKYVSCPVMFREYIVFAVDKHALSPALNICISTIEFK